MKRRQCVFWFGFGVFTLGERMRVGGFDTLAAAAMRFVEPATAAAAPEQAPAAPEHSTADENRTWRWYERETLIDGRWKLTGITTPIHKETGQANTGTGYLDESLVPAEVRSGGQHRANVDVEMSIE